MKALNARLRYLATALAVLGTCCVLQRAGYSDEPPAAGDDQGVEVQTRGPVHEAFAGVVTFNPEPGVVAPKAPPGAIEEVPPDQKPEGANVTWIPGYWAWDDERGDFLWVSGVWRDLPPGRQWLPGYWTKTDKGYQWTSGYWADAKATTTTYLPPPPATIERGPNIDQPTPDAFWAPGYWVWYDGRYAWRPGYWMTAQPDWDWCPAYYTWTPRGYVFVDGYWDYRVERRGVLFAPVYFGPGIYVRQSYYYSPVVVIDLAVFPDHLFLRPSYQHYYFGDYYAPSYTRIGFYASFSFQSRRHGYDPIYAQQRWDHRNDRGWEASVVTTYKYRRDHVDARPPRTWTAETRITAGAKSKDRSLAVATSFDQLAKRKDSPVRFQPVAKAEKQQIVQRGQEVRQSRDDRRTLESTAGDAPKPKSGKQFQPTTGKLLQSPILSPPYDQPGRERSQSNSQPVSRPSSNLKQSRDETAPGSNASKYDRPAEPPKSQYRERPVPTQPETKVEPERPVKREAKPVVVKPEAQPPVKERPQSEKGETRKERKSEQNKDEDRSAP